MKSRVFIATQVVLLALIGNTVVAGATLEQRQVSGDVNSPKAAQVVTQAQPLTPEGSGFTYQGSLRSGGNPANGQYDFTFALFDATTGGNQVGSTISVSNQTVTDGLFAVQLDFGAQAFQGDARWLEIAVRQTGGGSYTTLSPRQPLTPAPYAAGLMPGAVISGTVSTVVSVTNSSTLGTGIRSVTAAGGGPNAGVYGEATGLNGNGVEGVANSGTGAWGVEGSSSNGTGVAGGSSTGSGVYGFSNTGTGLIGYTGGLYGLYSSSVGTSGYGVFGLENGGTNTAGVAGTSSSGYGGVFTSTSGIAVRGSGNSNLGGLFTSSAGNGAEGFSSANNGIGLYGQDDTGTGASGVYGTSNSGTGVYAASGGQYGLYAYANAANGNGVYGRANNGSGAVGVYGTSSSGYGGYFTSSGTNGYGVYGQANSGSYAVGVAGMSSGFGAVFTSTGGIGVQGSSSGGPGGYFASSNQDGVQGYSTEANGAGVLGAANNGASAVGVYGDSTSGSGVYGHSSAAGPQNGTPAGVAGVSSGGNGVYGSSIASAPQGSPWSGVYGSSYGYGVRGEGLYDITNGSTGMGVYGHSAGNVGVEGENDGDGQTQGAVIGVSTFGPGVYGIVSNGNAIQGYAGSGYAGYFYGNVHATGSCCASGQGTIQIDDPTDPANKYLNQSVVASPDMLEIYRGHVTLDAGGGATVQLPSYSQALNRDFDYQLTPVGAPMPGLYVAQEVEGNTFAIAGGKPGGKVSWQMTGVRQDPYALAHAIQPEQEKPADQQGKYLYPKELGQPESLGVDYEKTHQQPPVAQPTEQPLPSGH